MIKELSIGRYAQKWCIFMLTFIIWSLIYTVVLVDLHAYHEYTLKGQIVNTIIDTLIGHFHFWYLFLISGLYLTIPVLQVIAKTEEIRKVFGIFTFVVGFFLPTLCLNETVNSIIGKHANSMSIGVLGGYCLYFLLGYWLKDCEIQSKKWICIGTLLAGIYTILVSNIVPLVLGYEIRGLRENCTPNVFIFTVGLFLLVRSKYKDLCDDRISNVYLFLSKYSFGVYLIHMLIMNLIKPLCLRGNPVESLIALCSLTLLFSYTMVSIIYKNKQLRSIVS